MHLICGNPDLGLKRSNISNIILILYDIFRGFSGCPLVCEEDGKSVLHGIVSQAHPTELKGLFVDVYEHLKFIQENIFK